jgi:pyruvate carboxylase
MREWVQEPFVAIQDVPSPDRYGRCSSRWSDRVNAGEEIIIIEAVNMVIPVEGPAAATLVEVVVRPPNKIEEGQFLLRLEVQR